MERWDEDNMSPKAMARPQAPLNEPPQPPVIAFHEVVARRAERLVLDRITLEVPEKQVTVVAGPSGAGKTTLLRLCNRLDKAESGRILYRRQDIGSLDPLWLRRKLGMVFQTPVLFPGTVRDNLYVADPAVTPERCMTMLERVSLSAGLLDREANALSGGEGQRVCLARTLLTQPDVLLADEPTSGLDPTSRLAFERLATALASDGLTVVWVTHDLAQLRRLADHVLVLVAGSIRFAGRPDEMDRCAGLRGFLSGEDYVSN